MQSNSLKIECPSKCLVSLSITLYQLEDGHATYVQTQPCTELWGRMQREGKVYWQPVPYVERVGGGTVGQPQGSERWLTRSHIAQMSIKDAHTCWEARHRTLSGGRLAGIPGQVCWQALLSLIPEALVFVKCRRLEGWRGPGWCVSAPGSDPHSSWPPGWPARGWPVSGSTSTLSHTARQQKVLMCSTLT